MRISEILSIKQDFTIVTNTERVFQTRMLLGDETYEFFAVKMPGQKWGIAFGNIVADRLSYELTYSGQHNQVLSFVKDSIFEFIKEKNPSSIVFEADKAGGKLLAARGNAYERLLNRFKPNGWVIDRHSSAAKDDIFTLVKTDK
jgi:hypothetical protein